MFDEEFIKNLPQDKWLAAKEVCNVCSDFLDIYYCNRDANLDFECDDDILKTLIFFEKFLNSSEFGVKCDISDIDISNEVAVFQKVLDVYQRLSAITKNKISKQKYEKYQTEYGNLLGNGFAYVFSEGDLKKIQALTNELRDLITESDKFEENHRQRILKKLEKFQQEIHKRMSNLDCLWGLIGDAGVMLGKFGEDAKPFVDRITEIIDACWRTQTRAEELESNLPMPMLENKKDNTLAE